MTFSHLSTPRKQKEKPIKGQDQSEHVLHFDVVRPEESISVKKMEMTSFPIGSDPWKWKKSDTMFTVTIDCHSLRPSRWPVKPYKCFGLNLLDKEIWKNPPMSHDRRQVTTSIQSGQSTSTTAQLRSFYQIKNNLLHLGLCLLSLHDHQVRLYRCIGIHSASRAIPSRFLCFKKIKNDWVKKETSKAPIET